MERVLLVTGGGDGIGRAIARGLAAQGWRVHVLGRTRERLLDTASAFPIRTEPVVADVGRAEEVAAAIAAIPELDAVVHCAGVNGAGPFLSLSAADWEAPIRSHLLGWANVLRAALPPMIARGRGRLVGIASRIAADPPRDRTAYAAAKAGQHALTRAVARELAAHPDVRVNELVPGPTKTRSNPEGREPEELVPRVRELLEIPAGGPCGVAFLDGEPVDPLAWKRPVTERLRSRIGSLLRGDAR